MMSLSSRLRFVVGRTGAGSWRSAASARALLSSKPAAAITPDPESALTETVRDFLSPSEFHTLLARRGLNFFAGVPDSLLKDFCAYVQDNSPAQNHVICANEGASVGLAAGYHLATNNIPVVYMQNSGFGNSVNPLISLCHPDVYSIPMLLLVGWRGEPGKRDEPQHLVQGRITPSLMADMGIPFEVLPDYIEGATTAIDTALHSINSRRGPYALLVRRQCFSKYKLQSISSSPASVELSREDALQLLVDNSSPKDVFVSTTGFTSRELFEIRARDGNDHSRDFLTVGSMGHASAISLGIALGKPDRQVWCLDGDGASIMHMGTMSTIGIRQPSNLKHVIFNNGVHDSVGGQPTGAFGIDYPAMAKSFGYKTALVATSKEEIDRGCRALSESDGPALLEIRIMKGARENLGRPRVSPIENKNMFMQLLSKA